MSKEVYNQLPYYSSCFSVLFSMVFFFLLASIQFYFLFLTHANIETLTVVLLLLTFQF